MASSMRIRHKVARAPVFSVRLPGGMHRLLPYRMSPGQTFSVGFEFECANKIFQLKPNEHRRSCPGVTFGLAGKSEEESWMPSSLNLSSLRIENFPTMPPCVKDVLWSYDTKSVKPGEGGVCNYHLEFKTEPLKTVDQLKEAMVGAGLALREASKRDGPEEWNVNALFDFPHNTAACLGSTHVTKAFVVNKRSLIQMLTQQSFMFCVKGAQKQSSGYDHVFRTSFPQAYIMWRSMYHCKKVAEIDAEKKKNAPPLTVMQQMILQRGKAMNPQQHRPAFEKCEDTLDVAEMCTTYWYSPEAAEKDVREWLFVDTDPSILDDVKTSAEACSVGKALVMACKDFAEIEEPDGDDFGREGDDKVSGWTGFGDPETGTYYGPGGPKGKDTSAKLPVTVSSDGTILYGFAEHRKDAWNTQNFRKCLYDTQMQFQLKSKEGDPAKQCVAGAEKFTSTAYCASVMEDLQRVEFAE